MWKRLACGPRYSCTRVKVGLVTSSSAAAAKAAAIPLTSVVFPAPRSPRSSTSLGGASNSASVRPKAIVSSAEWVMISRVIVLSLATDKIAPNQDQYNESIEASAATFIGSGLDRFRH